MAAESPQTESTDCLLAGVVPVIPTPFDAEERIDFDAVAACVRFAAANQIGAVCLPAYASEFYKLSDAEREQLVATAVTASDGRIRVIAQSNHPSAKLAAELAQRNADHGADLISFALPRLFALPEADLLDYSQQICDAVSKPVLIQDFNPAGSAVGADFCARLHHRCSNFRYVKLEEPLMGPKVRQIREATQDRVGVLEGWGGMYMMELLEPGVCGIMPGLGLGDLLQRVWREAQADHWDRAMNLFERLLPQIVFSLQTLEFYLWMEKDLLARRGVIPQSSTHVRAAHATPDQDALDHMRRLNERIVALAAELQSGTGSE